MILCALALAPVAHADMQLSSLGILEADSVKKFNGMRQHGVLLRYRLDRPGKSRWVPDLLDFSTGLLERGSDASVYLSFGPTYRFDIDRRDRDNWFVDFGVHPMYVAHSRFGDKSLGGKIQFTSSLSLGSFLNRKKTFSAALRYQHTSNAGLSNANPGVDMLGLVLSYRFGRERLGTGDPDNQN